VGYRPTGSSDVGKTPFRGHHPEYKILSLLVFINLSLNPHIVVEIRSIQVLDDDQEEVMPGTRVGLALRNIRLEDMEDVQALVKPDTRFMNSINNFTKFKWSDDAREVHVVFNGIKVMGRLGNGEVKLSRELPLVNGRALVINVNAKPRRPRIMGYADISA